MKEEFGTVLESGAMRFVRDFPGPVERVWAWLADPAKRGLWFCGGTMGEKAGDRFTLRFENGRLGDEPVPERFAAMAQPIEMEAEIVAIDPPRLLVFRWLEDGVESRFELAEADGRVRLTLIQQPPPSLRDRIGMAAGWHAHLGLLADRIGGEPPRGFWSEHGEAERHYSAALA